MNLPKTDCRLHSSLSLRGFWKLTVWLGFGPARIVPNDGVDVLEAPVNLHLPLDPLILRKIRGFPEQLCGGFRKSNYTGLATLTCESMCSNTTNNNLSLRLRIERPCFPDSHSRLLAARLAGGQPLFNLPCVSHLSCLLAQRVGLGAKNPLTLRRSATQVRCGCETWGVEWI